MNGVLNLFPSAVAGGTLAGSMVGTLQTVAAFAIVIGVLVFVHELGHYLAARWRGVEVEVFSIGIGRKLFGWRDRTGTVWQLSAVPIGGYVKMLGQTDLGVDDAPRTRVQFGARVPSRSFADKSVASRAIIVAAGPVFNFVFAILVFTAVYAVSGRPSDRPMVAGVVAGSPAQQAGLAPRDVILRIDGEAVHGIASVPAMVARHPGQAIPIVVSRGGHDVTVTATPRPVLTGGHRAGMLGITVGADLGLARLSLPQAFGHAVVDTVRLARQILVVLWHIVSGQGGLSNMHGALVIAKVSGQAAAAGPSDLLFLLAMVSVNLGLVNLLPVPVLDGGHLMFYAIEAVLRRPLSRRAQLVGLQAGVALIAAAFLFTTVNDLSALGLFRWMQSLAG